MSTRPPSAMLGRPQPPALFSSPDPMSSPPPDSPYQSASTRLFQESAEELAFQLEQQPSEGAALLAREARELAARFRAWTVERPSDEERVATLQRLFELNRQAVDYLAA